MPKTKTAKLHKYLASVLVAGIIFLLLLTAAALVVRLTLPPNTSSITSPASNYGSNNFILLQN